MKPTILSEESYSSLIKLREYFIEQKLSFTNGEFINNLQEYNNFKECIDSLDEIILEKFKSDIEINPYQSPNLEN